MPTEPAIGPIMLNSRFVSPAIAHMLTIRAEQEQALRQAAERHSLKRHCEESRQNLSKAHPQVVNGLSKEIVLAVVSEAVEAAWRYQIEDFDDHCLWVYLRLVSDNRFWQNPIFARGLNDKLFHPSAKVRNLAVSYQAAATLGAQQKRG